MPDANSFRTRISKVALPELDIFKFQIRPEGFLKPTIYPEGVCVIIQITVLIIVCPFVSRVYSLAVHQFWYRL